MTVNTKQIKYAIKNYKQIASKQLYTEEKIKADKADGFTYVDTLENDGFYIIAVGDSAKDIDFDYGDTSSDGLLISGANPLSNLNQFEKDLLAGLKLLLK